MPGNKNSLLTTFSDLSQLLYQFPLSDSVHVSLSWALPQAFAFWTILFLVALGGTYSYNRSVTFPSYESKPGVPPFRVIVCRCFRLALYAGLLIVRERVKNEVDPPLRIA
jgi:hypothetical protein